MGILFIVFAGFTRMYPHYKNSQVINKDYFEHYVTGTWHSICYGIELRCLANASLLKAWSLVRQGLERPLGGDGSTGALTSSMLGPSDEFWAYMAFGK